MACSRERTKWPVSAANAAFRRCADLEDSSIGPCRTADYASGGDSVDNRMTPVPCRESELFAPQGNHGVDMRSAARRDVAGEQSNTGE